MSNVELHFFAANDLNGATIHEVTDEDDFFERFEMRVALGELGAGEFTFNRKVGFFIFDSGMFAPETFVRVLIPSISPTEYVWGFFLDARMQTVISTDESGGEKFVFGGPGPKFYLSRAALLPEQFTGAGWLIDLANGVFRWAETASAGRILTRLLAEDNANTVAEALPDLTTSFDQNDDSDSVAWANDIAGSDDFEVPIGQSFLEDLWALEDTADLETTMYLGTVGTPVMRLDAWQAYGRDLTGATITTFTPGVHFKEATNIVTDLTVNGSSLRKASHVIVRGMEGTYVVVPRTTYDPGEYVKYALLEVPDIKNTNVLTRRGLHWIRHQDNGEREIVFEILPGFIPTSGRYFPGQTGTSGHFWVGDTVSLTTGGVTWTPLDYRLEDQRVMAIRMVLDEAAVDTDANTQALSWHVLPELNVERASASLNDQGGGGAAGCNCPALCHAGVPGVPPEFVAGAVEFENDDLLDVLFTVVGGADHALYVGVLSQPITDEVRYYHNGGGGGFANFTKLGDLTDVVDVSVTQRLSVWRLLAPTATIAGSFVRAVQSGDTAGMIGVIELSGVNQTNPEGSLITDQGVGTDSSISVSVTSGQLALNWAGWMFKNASSIVDSTAGGGQTSAFSDSFNNSAGRADGAWAGGYGSSAPTWAFATSRDWVAAGLAVNGEGGTVGGDPQDIGLVGDIGDDATAARCDHTHAHGLLSPDGDSFHSLAQTSNDPSGNGLDPNAQVAFDEQLQVASVSDPTVDDDNHAIGTVWVNTTSDDKFILVDDTVGAADWDLLSSGTGAPTTADYLVGTTQAGLSAEIVVGTTPGGELGNTWASPTVDATHAGSDHLQPVRKNSGGSDFTRRRLNLIEGSNVTLTVADDAGNDEVDITVAASASGGGLLAQAYAGYDTIGGSWEVMNPDRVYAKKITLANDCLLATIEGHVRLNSDGQQDDLWTVLYSDSSGTPALILHHTAHVANSYVLDAINGVGGESVGRWYSQPCGRWLTAGDYWIAVRSTGGSTQSLAYDATGSDRYMGTAGDFFTDWGFATPTTTANEYSIRANTVR